jgi:hypothetical protein
VLIELTAAGEQLAREAPSLLQEHFHRELSRLEEWEQTMILATLQRIASMMDAQHIEVPPVLISGDAETAGEGVAGYLDETVLPADEGPFAEELPGAISEYPAEEPNRHAQGEA